MKITYSEILINGDLEKEVEFVGVELNTKIKHDWEAIVEHYTKLYELGMVDGVYEDKYDGYVEFKVVNFLKNGGQYHRIYTKCE